MKLGQQLKMTPQLQQAIRLLQLSTMELSQEIQLALDSNPMLEAEDEFQNSDTELAEAESDIDLAVADGNDAVDEFAEASEAEVSEQFEEPLTESMPSDSTWMIFTPNPARVQTSTTTLIQASTIVQQKACSSIWSGS